MTASSLGGTWRDASFCCSAFTSGQQDGSWAFAVLWYTGVGRQVSISDGPWGHRCPNEEWATEIIKYSKIKLWSSNYGYIRGWFHLAVQWPRRGCVTAGGCSMIKANRLFILWHRTCVLSYMRLILSSLFQTLWPHCHMCSGWVVSLFTSGGGCYWDTICLYRIQTQIFGSVILVATSAAFMPLFFLSKEQHGVVLPL